MPAATFDGINLLVNTPAGVTGMDAQEDFYEPWKVFLNTPGVGGESNRGFPQLFRPIAGDDITAGFKYLGMFFMQNQNGWRMRLPDENITLTITGNMALQDTSVPFFTPRAGRTGAILGLPTFATTAETGISGLTAAESLTIAKIDVIEDIARNRYVINRVTNKLEIYNKASSALLFAIPLFEDAGGVTPVGPASTVIDRRDRIE